MRSRSARPSPVAAASIRHRGGQASERKLRVLLLPPSFAFDRVSSWQVACDQNLRPGSPAGQLAREVSVLQASLLARLNEELREERPGSSPRPRGVLPSSSARSPRPPWELYVSGLRFIINATR